MIKYRIIPFSWLPASWGLAGPQREEAEAYYNYDGYHLEERLAHIRLSGEMLDRRIIELQFEHGIIDEAEHDRRFADMIADDVERKVAQIDSDIRLGAIDAIEGDKLIATTRGEPWIRVVNDGLDQDQGVNGYYFEFDWNEIWIDQLREAGYTGTTEEAIVQGWFQEVCKREAAEANGVPINSPIY